MIGASKKIKCRIEKASDYKFREYKEFDTLLSLLEFVQTHKSVVIEPTQKEQEGAEYIVMIYDAYIE